MPSCSQPSRTLRAAGGPKAGHPWPPLRASAYRACRSGRKDGTDRTKGLDQRRQNLDTGPKSPTRFHEEAVFVSGGFERLTSTSTISITRPVRGSSLRQGPAAPCEPSSLANQRRLSSAPSEEAPLVFGLALGVAAQLLVLVFSEHGVADLICWPGSIARGTPRWCVFPRWP